ncbi:MAG: hypothetical protein IJK58_05410 [Clostridia bacterium]|nr:hypothetical protein [Clostridia bacterium]
MNKKLIALILGLFMLLSVLFTGCNGSNNTETGTGEDNPTEQSGERKVMTLSLWLPTDPSTTQAAVKKVEKALNEITELKFSTHLEIHAIPDGEYQEAIDAKIDSIADVEQRIKRESESLKQKEIELAEQGIRMDEYVEPETEAETDEETVETMIDEEGEAVSVYPEVREDQLDIFLIRGYDNYKRYAESELAEMLDSELTGNSRLLRTYIYPSFLECVNQGGIYAIPNNHVIGEYQYLLINKELADKYDYDESEFDSLEFTESGSGKFKIGSFANCLNFIVDIGDMHLDGVTPLLGDVEVGNMVYFSSDGNWSLLGDRIQPDYSYKYNIDTSELVTTLDLPIVTEVNRTMKQLEALGYVGDGTVKEGEKFAVGVVKGDFTLKEKYQDDYYIKIHAVPYADEDDIFASMFAVSPYTKSVSRSMEIITYLNTNETFRTILQYGVQGVHWDIDPNNPDVIIKRSDDYKMNIVDTGNIFMTYPDYGVPMSYWDDAKQQNLDSATSPYVGFEYLTDNNLEEYGKLAALSAKVKAQLDESTYENYQKVANTWKRELVDNTIIKNMLKEKESEMEDPFVSMLQAYLKSK